MGKAIITAKLKLPVKRSKYRAVPVVVDGIRFASKKEARRWGELKLMERANKIQHLKRQVCYPLLVNGRGVGSYFADFSYDLLRENSISLLVVEDVKGYRTREYKLKKKLMLACYGIEIMEL